MPTIFTHPAVALTKTWFRSVPRRALFAGMFGTIVPDFDIAAFAVGIPYGHTFGHRGFSHSIVFAILFARREAAPARRPHSVRVCLTLHDVARGARRPHGRRPRRRVLLAVQQQALLLSVDADRVSPIGAGFFSARGLETLASEVVWVWTPAIALALFGKYVVHRKREAGEQR